jgi:hypothetical protein
MKFRSNLIAAVAIFAILSAITILVASRQMPPTGDEPHYLLAAHSLVVDGDISMLNNYKEQQYRLFYPGPLAKRTTANFDKTRELPAFALGLSLFLAPFYKLALTFFPASLVVFLRLVQCAVTSFAVYHLLVLGQRLTSRFVPALVVIAGAVLASPLLTYCNQFYPEILAFLLIVLALRLFALGSSPSWKVAVGLSLVSTALIWLHPKYLILAIMILLICLFQYFRAMPRNVRLAAFQTILTLAGIFSFFVFLHSEYGSWSPNRIYGGWQKQTSLIELVQQMGFERVMVMMRMFFGYWLDQRFGIIPYAPFYIAFFPAVVWFARRSRSTLRLPLLALFASHFLVLCWAAQMGGYAPPSRHFVVLIPLLILPMMGLLCQLKKQQRAILLALMSLGWTVSAAILTHYRLIFTNATWRNPDGMSSFWQAFGLDGLIPNMTASNIPFLLVTVWCLLVFLLSSLLYPRRDGEVEL